MNSHNHLVLVGRKAQLYDRMATVALGWLYRAIAVRIVQGLPADGVVLDVGTGPGRLPIELARRRSDVRVVGVDPSADMIGHASRRVAAAGLTERIEVRVAAAEALPFADASFDAVVSSLSAHHWADVDAAIAEQSRVLSDRGVLWVFDLRKSEHAVAGVLSGRGTFSVTRPRLRGLLALVLGCHRAVKCADASTTVTTGEGTANSR